MKFEWVHLVVGEIDFFLTNRETADQVKALFPDAVEVVE